MSTNWRSVLNNYLADFEAKTTTVLNNINELLSKSGQQLDDRIKSYFVKSVNSRLVQTLDFFDIQISSQVHENEYCPKDMVNSEPDENNRQMGLIQAEDVEIIEIHPIKIECISSGEEDTMKPAEGVTSSYLQSTEANAEATQPLRYERTIYRPSLDSNHSDQRSTCSPSTSNQPMMSSTLSPIETFGPSPKQSPDINLDDIKQEPHDRLHETLFRETTPDECVSKMKDVQIDSMQMRGETNERQPTGQAETDAHQKSLIVIPEEPQREDTLKRRHSLDIPNETIKRPKTGEEIPFNEPISMMDKNIKFACCNCKINSCFKTFTEVYDHWKVIHESHSKPFRFVAIATAACFYCDTIDTFPALQYHHNHNHHSETFAVVNRHNKSNCGLCHQEIMKSEMAKHFKERHPPQIFLCIKNPICFTQSEMDQLLTLNPSQETDEPGQMEAFCCGYCKCEKKTSEISFQQHIEQDAFQIVCTMCKFLGNNIREMTQHEASVHNLTSDVMKHERILKERLERYFLRTRIMFSNGLVLYKHNMLNTDFDDQEEFRRFVSQKVEEYRKPTNQPDDVPNKTIFERKQELQIQRSYRTNLFITGIQNNSSDLPSRFLGICEAIGLPNITRNQIEDIFRRSNGVIVKLIKCKLKEKILRNWRTARENGELKKSFLDVHIQNHLTPFFVNLRKYAKQAKANNYIQSFWITDDGLKVKRNATSKAVIVWSNSELLKYSKNSI